MPNLTRRELLVLAGCGVLATPGVTVARGRLARASAPASTNPFAGTRLYVDPDSQAAKWVRANERTRSEEASLIRRIAEQPTAMWSGRWKNDPASGIRDVLQRAGDRFCVFVAYNIPHRDLGQYSAGGAPDADAYLKWFDALLAGIGDHHAALIFEPDALAHLNQLPPAHQQTRKGIFQRAMKMVTDRPRLAVYIDAGHPEWHSPTEMATRLAESGVAEARGFSLNVSNFIETPRCLEYGRQLLDALHARGITGKGFVIDTGRNGAGPWRGEPEAWCNPPGRALGDTPREGPAPADALLWIKPPGDSDGACRQGPPAGRFWPEYALDLVRATR